MDFPCKSKAYKCTENRGAKRLLCARKRCFFQLFSDSFKHAWKQDFPALKHLFFYNLGN